MLALIVQVDKDNLHKLSQETSRHSPNRPVINIAIRSRDKTDFKSVLVYL